MATPPPLSVVMPVHNALPHLDAAVTSVLEQSFADFELVIHDDGSTDGSTEALRAWAARDARVRVTHDERRLGPVGSSNRVMSEARAPIVARMDADDVAHRDRLARQLQVLEALPDAVAVGALHETIDASGRIRRPPDGGRLARRSMFAPFPHSSLMVRRSAFDAVGGYREACRFWEDVDLYLRLARQGRIAVVAEPLVRVRHSANSTRRRSEAVELAYDRMYRSLDAWTRTGVYSLSATDSSGRLDPRVFVALGSIALWAGERPRALRRMFARARRRPDAVTLASFTWALWAAASPRSLRAVLRLRNRLLARDGGGQLYEWAPGLSARSLA